MGVVFLGEDAKLGRKVAIKAMLPHLAGSMASHQRFLREAKTATTLEHDHIVPIFHGANLLIARPAAGADGPPQVKVVDFGLARLQAKSQTSTLLLQSEKGFAGTPDFVSPEQARDVHAVDVRSDLYSLGCTFYFALTGQRPFPGVTPLETLVKNLQDEAEPLEARRADVPPALAAAIRRLMAKDPAQRFQTPAELVEALRPLPEGGAPCSSWPPWETAAGLAADPDALPATGLVPELAFWSKRPEKNASTKDRSAQATPATDGWPAAVPDVTAVVPRDVASTAERLMAATANRTEADGVPADEPPPAAAQPDAFGAPWRLDPALHQLWRQWTAAAELIAAGRTSPELDAPIYRRLHRDLLAACRAAMAGAPNRQGEMLQRLETLVEPWLTPDALTAMDAEARGSLLDRCRQLDRALGWAIQGRSWWRWAGLVGAVLVGLVLAAWLGGSHPWGRPAGVSVVSVRAFIERHPLIAMAVLLPSVVAGTVYLFAHLRRP
jgi:hypothetical protein